MIYKHALVFRVATVIYLEQFLPPLLLATIASALNILKVVAIYQYLALGALLIFALALDTARRELIARSRLSHA